MSGHLDYEINKELGECYLFMGEMDKAEEYYKKAVASNGVHAEPYLGLATIAVQLGDLDKAYALYVKASKIEENDRALAGMALIELESGRLDEAYINFSRAVTLNPENHVALFGLVRLGHMDNNLERIIPHLRDCLQNDPLQNDIRFSLAGCLVSLGEVEEACQQLEYILENEPGHAAATELMQYVAADAA
ncbi:tetratricopeptide repeat protein [Desulfovibrio inopinatus]|uniref:tetratricopeptide repeat protein n=1 Tax=Desulfovibrio inopinatus TaxID=102109 RepID=UPI0004066E29|nr:tetratricopeptide repeat protein [Desulfovibrio inopinatus]